MKHAQEYEYRTVVMSVGPISSPEAFHVTEPFDVLFAAGWEPHWQMNDQVAVFRRKKPRK